MANVLWLQGGACSGNTMSFLNAEEPIRTSRLMLSDLTAKTLRLGLDLLGISVLERM